MRKKLSPKSFVPPKKIVLDETEAAPLPPVKPEPPLEDEDENWFAANAKVLALVGATALVIIGLLVF